MAGEELIRFNDVACMRGGRLLFEGLCLSVCAGEALVLTGPNGIGKSSLIRIAAGLLPPAAGKVFRPQSAALLGHDLALDEAMPLAAALRFWARLDGVEEAAVERAMQAFALTQLAPAPVRYLSSGQRRRAGLARVVASGARLWLLDEPGVGLDDASLALLAAAMADHRAAGGAVLAATHMDLGLEAPRLLDLGRLSGQNR